MKQQDESDNNQDWRLTGRRTPLAASPHAHPTNGGGRFNCLFLYTQPYHIVSYDTREMRAIKSFRKR